jgi:hypothetical protein
MFITPSYRLSHKKQQERCLVVTEGVFLKATTEAKKNKNEAIDSRHAIKNARHLPGVLLT